MVKDTILLTSGFRPETVSLLKPRWDIAYYHPHMEALEYIESCDALPLAVVIGYVKRTPFGERPDWSDDDPELPAHVMLRKIQDIDPDLPVIVSASYFHSGSIVELIKRGAFDYVTEPPNMIRRDYDDVAEQYSHELYLALDKAVRWRKTVLENRELRHSLENQSDQNQFVTRCREMYRVLNVVSKVAPTPASVLITGESGTGKELIARMIHRKSDRRNKPFVAINCGAMSESLLASELFGHVKGAFTGADVARPGLIRQAGEGTMFLDEIAATSLNFQVMLLRVLEEKTARPVGAETEYPVWCRFVAAANCDLHAMTQNGEFREDLYYRLNMFHLDLIPLRERPEDIPAIANHFLLQFAAEYQKDIKGFAAETIQKFETYPWPGNVRQLRNTIERAVILCDGDYIHPRNLNILSDDAGRNLPPVLHGNYRQAMENYEKTLLRKLLAKHDGNVALAARSMGMNRTTLLYRIKKLGLKI